GLSSSSRVNTGRMPAWLMLPSSSTDPTDTGAPVASASSIVIAFVPTRGGSWSQRMLATRTPLSMSSGGLHPPTSAAASVIARAIARRLFAVRRTAQSPQGSLRGRALQITPSATHEARPVSASATRAPRSFGGGRSPDHRHPRTASVSTIRSNTDRTARTPFISLPAGFRRERGRGARRTRVPRTVTARLPLLLGRRKHVVEHRDHHGDRDDRVVEQVKFHPRDHQLRKAQGHRGSEKILSDNGLSLKKRVLDMMPELDPERDHPPCVRPAGESLSQEPESRQHHKRVEVM